MAGFGKADIGLIKATAGAEQSKFVDDSLMIGSVVGGMVDSLNKKAQVQAGIQAGIEKDINDKFPTVSTNVGEEFSKNLLEFVPGQKTEYANAGGGIFGKSKQTTTLQNTTDYYAGVEAMDGQIKANKAYTGSLAAGIDPNTQRLISQVDAGDYSVYTARDQSGKPMPMIAIPTRVKADASTFTYEDDGSGVGNVQSLLDFKKDTLARDPNATINFSPNQQTAIDNYNKANKNYTDWEKGKGKVGEGGHKLANGTPNPEYFHLRKDIPSKEGNLDNARAEMAIFNGNVTNLKGDPAHLSIGNSKAYAGAYEKQVEGYAGIDLQNALFTDASNDGINGNSYGDFFIQQKADPKKHPNMYLKANGKPIEFTIEQEGKEVAIPYSSEAGSPFQLLPGTEQERLLKMYITGQDTKGGYNPDANSEFLKNGYSNFMGGVTKDAAAMKQKLHFSNKGMYFNNGDGNPVNSNALYKDDNGNLTSITENRQKTAYSNHKFNAAFPESMLGGDDFNKNLTATGSIGKALLAEFPDADLSFVGNGIVEIDGVETPFDFTGNNKKQEMQRLREYLSENANYSDREKSLQKSMSKDVSGDDWKSMRRKKAEYHGYAPVNDYLRFEKPDGNLASGPLTVSGYNEETKMYDVQDQNNNTMQVDEETLYPNGI